MVINIVTKLHRKELQKYHKKVTNKLRQPKNQK